MASEGHMLAEGRGGRGEDQLLPSRRAQLHSWKSLCLAQVKCRGLSFAGAWAEPCCSCACRSQGEAGRKRPGQGQPHMGAPTCQAPCQGL